MILLEFDIWKEGSGAGVVDSEGYGLERELCLFVYWSIHQKISSDSIACKLYNKMMNLSQVSEDSKPRSIIATLYRTWDIYSVPAIHYHYFLAILPSKDKRQQATLMSYQIQLLRQAKDYYHQINTSLNARQKSLAIIKQTIGVLKRRNLECFESQFNETKEGFNVVLQSQTKERKTDRKLEQLICHLKNYQSSTYQVTIKIFQWQTRMHELGYQGFVQFLYRHSDYLTKMMEDTHQILEEFSSFFQNNLFLIFKKQHQFTEYALVFQNLKFHPDFVIKIQSALGILSNHHSERQRLRILGRYRKLGSRKQLQKVQSLKGIYCNYHRNSLIITDTTLLGDKSSLISQNRVLVNPESSTLSKSTSKFRVLISENDRLRKNKSEVRLSPLAHKVNVISGAPSVVEGSNSGLKQLNMLGNLSKGKGCLKMIQHPASILPQAASHIRTEIEEQALQVPNQFTLQFLYQSKIDPKHISTYLRHHIFPHQHNYAFEQITKIILKHRECVTLIRVNAQSMLVAWLAVCFITNSKSFRKTVDIKSFHTFLKLPNLESQLVQQFVKRGYGRVEMKGRVVSQCIVKSRLSHRLVGSHYKIREVDGQVVKKVMKTSECLKRSRILKYYTYSRSSKYHDYCEHKDQECRISFEVESVSKISFQGESYLKAKCDRIQQIRSTWKVDHHLNKFSLIVAKQISQIIDFGQLSEVQSNSSLDSPSQTVEKQYLCLPQAKCINQYLDTADKPIVAEYLTISGDVPEVRSLNIQKGLLKDSLVLQRPFFLAFVCNSKDDYGKTIAILHFD